MGLLGVGEEGRERRRLPVLEVLPEAVLDDHVPNGREAPSDRWLGTHGGLGGGRSPAMGAGVLKMGMAFGAGKMDAKKNRLCAVAECSRLR